MKRFLIGFCFPESRGTVDYVIGFGNDMQEAKDNFVRNIKDLPFDVFMCGCYEVPDFIEGCFLDDRKIAKVLRYYAEDCSLAKYCYFAFINQ